MTKVRDQDKFMVRLPDGMREKISADAKAKGRSMNAEIVARIANSAPEKTLRDEIAMAALTGMLPRPEIHSMIKDDKSAAEFCYRQADAFLAAREVQHD